MPINSKRYEDYTDNTLIYTNISNLTIDSLVNLSFSKINRIFLQEKAINSNISFNDFIRGKQVDDYSENINVPNTELNLSVDKFLNSHHIINNYNIVASNDDIFFTKNTYNDYKFSNIILDRYINTIIDKSILNSIVNINFVFNNNFNEIIDILRDGAIKIDLNLIDLNDFKYLKQVNIINDTTITGERNNPLTVNNGALNIYTSLNKNINLNIYDDNNKINDNSSKIKLTLTNIPHNIYSDKQIFTYSSNNFPNYYLPTKRTSIILESNVLTSRIDFQMVSIESNIYIFAGKYINVFSFDSLSDYYRIDTRTESIQEIYNDFSSISARCEHSMVAINNDLYIFGGIYRHPTNSIVIYNDLYKIDTITDSVETIFTNIQEISPRYGSSMVAINNDLYIFGGVKDDYTTTNDLFKINIVSKNVTRILVSITKRYKHSMVAINNDIYILGGTENDHNDDTVYNNKIFKINIETNNVTCICETIPDAISNRVDIGMVAIYNNIYLYGGSSAKERDGYNDLYKFNINNNSLIKILDNNLTTYFHYHKIVAINNDIYTIKKSGFEADYINDFEKITVNNDVLLTYIPKTLRVIPLLTSLRVRYEHGMVLINNDIYIFGGNIDSASLNDLFKIDTMTNVVTSIYQSTPNISIRTAPCMVAVNHYLYIYGGFNYLTTYNDLYKINTINNVVTKIYESIPNISVRRSSSMVSIDNNIYIFGGYTNSTFYNDLYKIDTKTDNVEIIFTTIPEISPRYESSMLAINSNIYIFGGAISHSVNKKDLFKIDTKNKSVTMIYESTPKISERKDAKMLSINNDIYILGGIGISEDFNDYYKINTQDDSVQQLWLNNNNNGIYSTYSFKSIVKNNDIYLYGWDFGTRSYAINTFYKITKSYIPMKEENITLNPVISNRNNASMVAINSHNAIYIFGGNKGTLRYNDLLKINTINNTVSELMGPDNNNVISHRNFHSMVSIGNDIYIYGGKEQNDVLLKDLYKINIEPLIITQLLSNDSTNPISTSEYSRMVAINNDIYIFGGFSEANSDFLVDMTQINISTNPVAVNKYTTSSAIEIAELKRYQHSMVAINNDIYIFGGRGYNGPLNDLWKFDTVQKTFTKIWNNDNLRSISKRSSCGMVAIDTDIYIFGGQESAPYNNRLNDYYKINTLDDFSITVLWSNNTDNVITARSGHNMVTFQNDIYIFSSDSIYNDGDFNKITEL